MENKLISVRELKKYFEVKKGILGGRRLVKAVDGVSFDVSRGETIAVVGESGCGKTTLGKTVLGLYKPTEGEIIFEGKRLWDKGAGDIKWYRKNVGYVQQDPFGALPPFMTIRRILEEPLIVTGVKDKRTREKAVRQTLEEVQLIPVEDFLQKYPHMLSGGQQQRVAIARAIIMRPKFVVADEPVTMLDASIKVDILKLIERIRKNHNMSIIYITHDLSTVTYFTDWIFIMYAGQIVERARTGELLNNPQHPYTQALLAAIPDPDPSNVNKLRPVPPGEPPSLINPPNGCRYHPRCPFFMAGKCDAMEPPEIMTEKNHFVKCWLYG